MIVYESVCVCTRVWKREGAREEEGEREPYCNDSTKKVLSFDRGRDREGVCVFVCVCVRERERVRVC